MTLLSNNLSGGAVAGDAAAVTTGNSTGTGNNAFTLVNSTVAYDDDVPSGEGVWSAVVSSGLDFVQWNTLNGATCTARAYVYRTAKSGVNQQLIEFKTAAGIAGTLRINLTTGLFSFTNSAGTSVGSASANAYTNSQLFRVEFLCTSHASAGVMEVKLFLGADAHSTTPTETLTLTGQNTRGGNITTVSIGNVLNNTNGTTNFSALAALDTGAYPGPALIKPTPTVVTGVSTVPDVTITTGGGTDATVTGLVTVAGVGAIPAPSLSMTEVAVAVAAIAAVGTPAFSSTEEAAVVAAIAAVPAPSLSMTAVTTTVAAVTAIGTAVVPAVVPAVVVSAVAAVPAPVLSMTEVAEVVAAVAATPAPTVKTDWMVTPSVVPAVAAVGTPAFTMTEQADAVVAVAAVGSPTVSTSSSLTAVVVPAVAAVAAPTITTPTLVTPAVVAAVGAVPAPTVIVPTSQTVAVTRVQATATVPRPFIPGGASTGDEGTGPRQFGTRRRVAGRPWRKTFGLDQRASFR